MNSAKRSVLLVHHEVEQGAIDSGAQEPSEQTVACAVACTAKAFILL